MISCDISDNEILQQPIELDSQVSNKNLNISPFIEVLKAESY